MNSLASAFEFLSGGDVANSPRWWQVVFRSAFLFLLGLTLLRLGKSRLMGGATVLDVLVTLTVGSILSRGILGSTALSSCVIATTTLVVLHWIGSRLAMSSHWWGNLLKGHSYRLVSNGSIQWDNLRQSHMSEHDLYEQLRLNANVNNLDQIEAAYKERNGEVGVVRKQTPN